MFSFTNPNCSKVKETLSAGKGEVIVSLYHNLFFQKRLYLLTPIAAKHSLSSITELFTNSGWLERELSELSGVMFCRKRDTRNLMLPYSDNSRPFQKNYPSIGLKEIFYDLQSDYLIQQPVNIQF